MRLGPRPDFAWQGKYEGFQSLVEEGTRLNLVIGSLKALPAREAVP